MPNVAQAPGFEPDEAPTLLDPATIPAPPPDAAPPADPRTARILTLIDATIDDLRPRAELSNTADRLIHVLTEIRWLLLPPMAALFLACVGCGGAPFAPVPSDAADWCAASLDPQHCETCATLGPEDPAATTRVGEWDGPQGSTCRITEDAGGCVATYFDGTHAVTGPCDNPDAGGDR